MAIIITKARIPTINPSFYRPNRVNFTITSSLKLQPQSGLRFPVFHALRNSSLFLVNNQKATSLSFQCPSSRTDAGSDYFWTEYGPKLQTNLFICMLFLWLLLMLLSTIPKLIPKWAVVVSSFLLLMVKLIHKPKQKKPMNVSFDDLVCVEEAKHEFQTISRILKGEGEYKKIGLPCHGVLLYGPSGTGKSSLVHALACEAKVPFFPVSARDLASDVPLDGVVEIRELFRLARKNAPSIVFIEDIHAIAAWGENCESHPALYELYTEIKECSRIRIKVAIIAETNRPKEMLDSARSFGCFLTRLYVGELNKDAKQKITKMHLKKYLREEDEEVICNLVASQTPDLNWLHLEYIAYRCLTSAISRGNKHVTKADVCEALESIKIDQHW